MAKRKTRELNQRLQASRRRAFVQALLAIIIPLLIIPWGVARAKPSQSPPLRVLFIGNSYTFVNNLPEIIARLAEEGHQGKIETRMEAPGGWRLQDHWEKGEAPKTLREGKWDYVVLQEQSTLGLNSVFDGKPRVTSDAVFRPYAAKWAAEIRKNGAIPIFYLTWARKASPEDQAILNQAYLRAAQESGARVAPAGIAWAQVRQSKPEIELFLPDGSHPTAAGSYLAACTLYAAIFRQSPEGLPGKISGAPMNGTAAKVDPAITIVRVNLPEGQAKALQAAAWAAWQQLAEKSLP